MLAAALSLLATLAPVSVYAADLAAGVNELRRTGCEGKAGLDKPLRSDRKLATAAQAWSRGGRLSEALERADYRIVNSASIRIEGAPNDQAVLELLAQHYCKSLLEPTFTEIGVHRRGRDAWIVLAEPFKAPAPQQAEDVSQNVLKLVNAARAQPRRCGGKRFAAAPPLTLSPLLERAALAHSRDMARNELFDHRGSDGGTVAQRVSRTGYAWRTVGENIAAGAPDAQSVVQGWLDSPGHCANLMSPQFSQMGVAYAVDKDSKAGVYWAQVFATPR